MKKVMKEIRAKLKKDADARLARYSSAYDPGLLEDLKDRTFAAEYLTAAIDGNDDEEFEIFFSALANIVRAQGIEDVADKMETKRDTLYKMFRHKNPTFRSLAKLLDAVGLGIAIVKREVSHNVKKHA